METERDASYSVTEENVSTPTLTTSDTGTDSSKDEVSEGAMELHDEVSPVSEQDIDDDDGIVNTGSNVESSVRETSSPALRRFKRPTKPPHWMRDGEYAVNMVFRTMLNAVLLDKR